MATKKRKKAKPKAKKKVVKVIPPSKFAAVALDPFQKCGSRTTVEALYRVTETVEDKVARQHLVFFDRHGWYCEDGVDCPAVPVAVKEHTRIGKARK